MEQLTRNRYNRTTLFEVLEAQGRTQTWLARQVGCSRYLVSKIKLGKRAIPFWFAERASRALGLPESALFFAEELTIVRETLTQQESDRVA